MRAPRTAFGAILKPGGGNATKVVMAVLAVEWVLNLVSGGLLDRLLVMSNEAIYLGQFWRLVTAALTSGSILGVLMNLLVLWIAGRAIEFELGAGASWHFTARLAWAAPQCFSSSARTKVAAMVQLLP